MIYTIRGQSVMLDSDLVKLYGIETKKLKKAVRLNLARFPVDFMFEMTKEELENWRFQFGTSNSIKMGLRVQPFVFTELGVAMLSSILNSEQAVSVNISIMRTFTKLRSFLVMENSIEERVTNLEKGTHKMFKLVFKKLDSLNDQITPKLPANRKKIGIHSNLKD